MPQPSEPIRQWTQVNAWQIHARCWLAKSLTDARPIVLVHGLSVSSWYMEPLGRRLASHARVYAPDMPGFGLSTPPDRVLDIPQLADALAGWIETLGLARPVLVGNSMGCQYLVDLAVRYPALVSRAVLVAPSVDRHARRIDWQLLRLVETLWWEPFSAKLIVAAEFFRAGPVRVLRTSYHALTDHIEEKAPHVAIPVLIVRGTRDHLAQQRWVEELSACFPHGRLITVAGVPHMLNYSAPQQLLDAIGPFLTGQEVAADGRTHPE